MHSPKAIFLLAIFSFVLTHSVLPHHHGPIQSQPQKHHHHHHDADHEHQHENDHGDRNNILTLAQIDHVFLQAKNVIKPVVSSCPSTNGIELNLSDEDINEEFVERDILRPPLIGILCQTFRGPPLL